MKYLMLAVFLAVVQAAPPVPRKAPDTPARSSHNVQSSSAAQQEPSNPPPSSQEIDSAKADKQPCAYPRNADDHKVIVVREPSTVSVWEKVYVLFTGLLVIVGAVGIGYAIRTLRAIERQAQANVDQLTEIQQSAEKTDRMILIAAQDAENNRIATDAAKKSADAATATANSLIDSERAWINVTITKRTQTHPDKASGFVWFWPDVVNHGRTPAHITRVVIRPHQVPMGKDVTEPPLLPEKPEYASPESIGFELQGFVPPTSGITPIPVKITNADYAVLENRRKCLYIYGYVDYLDLSKQPRQFRFCEVLWFSYGPEDPHPAGFVTAGNTPSAYTQYT
jgi:hypothetical protein